mgnify:CR=1 FL=1
MCWLCCGLGIWGKLMTATWGSLWAAAVSCLGWCTGLDWWEVQIVDLDSTYRNIFVQQPVLIWHRD